MHLTQALESGPKRGPRGLTAAHPSAWPRKGQGLALPHAPAPVWRVALKSPWADHGQAERWREATMSVAKFIELSGQSSQGYEDAIRQAVERASRTIRNITSVWAKEFEAVVENNQVTQFRVVVKIAFVMDEGTGAG